MNEDPAEFAGAWNFGPYNDDVLTVQQVVERAIAEWGGGEFVAPAMDGQPHEAGLLKLDITRSVNELNWKPRMDSSAAIHQTINWYKQASASNAFQLVVDQITQYQTQDELYGNLLRG